MIDREKVTSELDDLRQLADTEIHPIISPDNWDVYSKLCDLIDLTKADILALLKEQEARVMTLKELAFYDSGIYVETHNGCPEGLTDELWPALVHLYCVSQNGEYGYVSFADWNADTYDFEAKDYNVNFRCWTSKPTDEQRKAVKWNDD